MSGPDLAADVAADSDPIPGVIDWTTLDAVAQARLLERPTQAVSVEVAATVAAILAEVATEGDVALRRLTRRFNGFEPARFEVDEAEFEAAERAVAPALRAAMVEAAARIEAFHAAGMVAGYAVDTAPDVRCERVVRPIGRVGLYVPAGSAPLPSTALMLGIPARLAGCPEVILCTPPRSDGTADPAVLVAARLCGIRRVFTLGGAQAIAAMAFGTASVPACDKLFGPGNGFVTEAKRQVAAGAGGVVVAIDMPAGPSEVLVIADQGANAEYVAADLLSQAEHGGDSQVILLSPDARLLDAVRAALRRQWARLPRRELAARSLQSARLLQVADLDQALAISNRYAPEHLILALRDARAWLPSVSAAGSVFLGDWTPEALGDYCSGTNHVLPTGGAARACSGLSVASFQNMISVQSATARGIAAIGPSAVTLANAEGLQAHANAVELRLRDARGAGA